MHKSLPWAIAVCIGLLAFAAPRTGRAQGVCPDNAHVERVETGDNVRTTHCACNAGYANVAGICMAAAPVPSRPASCTALQSELGQLTAASSRATLAADVYAFYDQTGGWQGQWRAPAGFTLLSNNIQEVRRLLPGKSPREIADLIAPVGSSYRAAIYRDDRTQTLFLVFRGTEELSDYTAANIPNELGMWTAYFSKAQTLAKLLKQSANQDRVKFEVVGHSLGGGLAVAAALAATALATTFNAECFCADFSASNRSANENDEAIARSLVTNYVVPSEAVSTLQDPLGRGRGVGEAIGPALGKRITLPDWPGLPGSRFTPAGRVERHKISNVRLAIQHQLDALNKTYADTGCRP